MAKIWRWVAIAAAVLGAIVAAFFAGGSRKKGDQAAAVDAAHADDWVKDAYRQTDLLANQSAELAAQSKKAAADIEAKRAALVAGRVGQDEIDRTLIDAGIIKP